MGGSGEIHQQGLGNPPCQPRTYRPLRLCSHRLCRLPNHSVCLDVWTLGAVQSTPAALSGGLRVDFPRMSLKQTPVQPRDPDLAMWKSESGSFSGYSSRFAPPRKTCYSSTYLHSIVC